MSKTIAAIRTRPCTFQTEATAPTLGLLPVTVLVLRFQIRRVRHLADA